MATLQNLTPAGSRVKAYLEGGPELAHALAELEKSLRDELLKDATLAGAEVIAEEWRARVPVDEGDYRASITAKSRAGKKGATAIVAVNRGYSGGPGDAFPDIVGRAKVLEFGVSGRKRMRSGRGLKPRSSKPSAIPAFEASKERAVAAVEDKVRDLLEWGIR